MTIARRLMTSGGGGTFGAIDYNDEFNGPNVDWVVVSSADFGDTTPGTVHIPSGNRIARPRVPPVPFTVTAYCSSILFDDIDNDYANASLAVGEGSNLGTTGPKHYALHGLDVAFLGHIGVIDGLWTNYSTGPVQGSYVALDGIEYQVPHYQRLVVHSGTNVDLYYSFNGSSWSTYATGQNPNLASVESVLLLSYACTTEWDWVRFS